MITFLWWSFPAFFHRLYFLFKQPRIRLFVHFSNFEFFLLIQILLIKFLKSLKTLIELLFINLSVVEERFYLKCLLFWYRINNNSLCKSFNLSWKYRDQSFNERRLNFFLVKLLYELKMSEFFLSFWNLLL